MKLSDLSLKSSAKVTALHGSGALRQRLLDMGIAKGTVVRMVRTAPLNDPIQIFVKGYNLALRRAEADLIEVAPFPAPGTSDASAPEGNGGK